MGIETTINELFSYYNINKIKSGVLPLKLLNYLNSAQEIKEEEIIKNRKKSFIEYYFAANKIFEKIKDYNNLKDNILLIYIVQNDLNTDFLRVKSIYEKEWIELNKKSSLLKKYFILFDNYERIEQKIHKIEENLKKDIKKIINYESVKNKKKEVYLKELINIIKSTKENYQKTSRFLLKNNETELNNNYLYNLLLLKQKNIIEELVKAMYIIKNDGFNNKIISEEKNNSLSSLIRSLSIVFSLTKNEERKLIKEIKGEPKKKINELTIEKYSVNIIEKKINAFKFERFYFLTNKEEFEKEKKKKKKYFLIRGFNQKKSSIIIEPFFLKIKNSYEKNIDENSNDLNFYYEIRFNDNGIDEKIKEIVLNKKYEKENCLIKLEVVKKYYDFLGINFFNNKKNIIYKEKGVIKIKEISDIITNFKGFNYEVEEKKVPSNYYDILGKPFERIIFLLKNPNKINKKEKHKLLKKHIDTNKEELYHLLIFEPRLIQSRITYSTILGGKKEINNYLDSLEFLMKTTYY